MILSFRLLIFLYFNVKDIRQCIIDLSHSIVLYFKFEIARITHCSYYRLVGHFYYHYFLWVKDKVFFAKYQTRKWDFWFDYY